MSEGEMLAAQRGPIVERHAPGYRHGGKVSAHQVPWLTIIEVILAVTGAVILLAWALR